MSFIESYFENTHKYNKGHFLKIPVISPPPSSAGGFHASDTLSCVVLVYDSGPFGIPGLSTTMTSISAESLPYSFFAVMVYFPESCLVEESIRKLVLSLVVCACTHSQERHCLPSHMLYNCLTALCFTISPQQYVNYQYIQTTMNTKMFTTSSGSLGKTKQICSYNPSAYSSVCKYQ